MKKSRYLAPSRLQLARELRGLTKRALAEAIGLTSMALSGYESGDYTPAPEVVQELAHALKFPPTWFEQDDISLVRPQSLTFRAQSRMTASLRDRAARQWDLAALVAAHLRGEFNLPPLDLPDLSGDDPETAAQTLRNQWRLGHEPIEHFVALLESRGILPFWSDIDSRTVDAYSHWDNDNPLVVFNVHEIAADRARFNAAHELGHLVLHHDALSGQNIVEEVDGEKRQQLEIEANRFASAFLMPEAAWLDVAPIQPVPEAFLDLKSHWGVSVAAQIRRNFDLELFSKDQYERAMTRLTVKGWRTREPELLEAETSIVHRKVLESLQSEGRSAEDLADELHLPVEDLFLLMPVARDFSRPQKPKREFRRFGTVEPKGNVIQLHDRREAA